jgi:antitoxin ParD1/3/4
MAKNASIQLDDYFDNFIHQRVESGKYESLSEVVSPALKMFEKEELKKAELVNELKNGEKSGFIENFSRTEFLTQLHKNMDR